LRELRHALDLVVTRLRISVDQVLAQRDIEQDRILRNEDYRRSQTLQLEITNIIPIQQHIARARVVHARNELRYSALPDYHLYP
jgi:hypothetical protein